MIRCRLSLFLSAILVILPLTLFASNQSTNMLNFDQQINKASITFPLITDNVVLAFANEALINLFSENFVTIQQSQALARPFLNSAAWQQYQTFLSNKDLVQLIQQKKLIMSAFPTAAPVVTRKGILQNAFSWQIQMPITIQLQSPDQAKQMKYLLVMNISRTNQLKSTPTFFNRGIVVSDIEFKSVK